MLGFHEKRKFKQYLYSVPVLIVLLGAVVALAPAVWSAYQKAQMTEEKKDGRARELAELKQRENMLKAELERLDSSQGVEAEIRQKFDVAKEGEEVLVIVDPIDSAASRQQAASTSIWERIKLFFTRD